MKNYILLELSLLLLCLSKHVIAKQAVFCQQGSGASGCLDSEGECTNTECEETCLTDRECPFNCCVDGYCTVDECGIDKVIRIIVIVVPSVIGTFILICIICCIANRRRLIQQRQVAILNANLNNNQIGINIQFQQGQMQDFNAIMLQQQYFQTNQQKPFQTQQQPYNPQVFQMQQQPYQTGMMPSYQAQQNIDKQQLLTKQNNQNKNNGGLVSYL